jgi:MFS family permease
MSSATFARTFAVTSCAWFLVTLDRLVVTTALPTIRGDLGAGLTGAEWTVNAYTLAFAALLLGGAALGDRFGRRRMFTVGMAVFTLGSTAAALAPTVGVLVAARTVQGIGAAVFAPLSLTLLTAATPPGRRGAVFGAWGAIGGAGAASGPLVGGALTALAGWRSVFWLVVPVGLAVVLAARRLDDARGPSAAVLPLHLFRRRAFALANAVALLHHAALFGSLFLVTHLLQAGLGAGPLDAGLRLLPMAVMPMLLAPLGGAAADRWGTRVPMAAGVTLVAAGAAGLAAVATPGVAYAALAPLLVLMGAGSGLFFAPFTAAVLGAAAPHEQGSAAGVATTVREVGAVLGVALLTAVLAGHGDLDSAARAVAGAVAALRIAAVVAGAGVLVALALPARPPTSEGDTTMSTAIVRPAGPTDHAAVRALLELSYRPYAADLDPTVWCAYRADLLDLDRHARHGTLLVAVINGEIVGSVVFYPDAADQDLGWPAGWASGRALAVHPGHRGRGVAGALLRELEQCTRESGAAVFAFHTSRFMTTARAIYERMGYQRVPRFDQELNVHYGAPTGARPWLALAYLKVVDGSQPAICAA